MAIGPVSGDGGRVVVVTGADSNYYWLLRGAVHSLSPHRARLGFDLAVLDFGMTEDQVRELRELHDAKVVRPTWIVDVPERFRSPRNLAFAMRCALPDLIPSYDVYFWFDSDGWVQDESFFERFVGPARRGALAIVKEQEPVYPFDWRLEKWNLGNQVLAFGPLAGLRVYLSPAINNGFFAASASHPVWGLWRKRFEAAVARSGKIIMDQHSLKAVIALDGVETHYLGGASNWISSRCRPLYDRARGCFCLPYPPHEKIAILHLAGAGKDLEHDVLCVGGGKFRTALIHAASARSAAECTSP